MSIADSDTRHNEDNPWNEICRSLLTEADIIINSPRPFDIQVHNQDFFKRVLKEGSSGLGESYMDGGDCKELDEFINRVIKADIEECTC